MSFLWSAVTGWRLCGAGLLKVHCTQCRARTPASLQQAKWTFLESLGLFNTPLGLKVTLLVLPGWRWRWWFCCESGFAVQVRAERAKLGGTSSLEWNWLYHLPLKLTVRLPGTESNSFAVVFSLCFVSLHLAVVCSSFSEKSINLTSMLARGTKQISLAWPLFWEFWPSAESFTLAVAKGSSSADTETQRKWQISHAAV